MKKNYSNYIEDISLCNKLSQEDINKLFILMHSGDLSARELLIKGI